MKQKFGGVGVSIRHEPEFIALATSLTQLAVKGTATAINTKIRAIKNEKDAEKIRNVYNEIINELLDEREEAVRIAQVYKSELDSVVISDEDIEHLHNTVSRLLEIIKKSQLSVASELGEHAIKKVKKQTESYEQMKELISVDTLKTMQLLGFNYKVAIGEPLTLMLKNFILSKAVDLDSVDTIRKVLTPEMVEVLKNKAAFDNFKQMADLQI